MQIGAHHHPYPHIVADWADGRGPDPSERVSATTRTTRSVLRGDFSMTNWRKRAGCHNRGERVDVKRHEPLWKSVLTEVNARPPG
jgi:hypothetical protein